MSEYHIAVLKQEQMTQDVKNLYHTEINCLSRFV